MAPLNPLELRCREQTVADKIYGFVINFIICGLSQFGEHIYDKKFNFVRVQKAKQDWTDKGDHSNLSETLYKNIRSIASKVISRL